MKVIKIDDALYFDNGWSLTYYHDQECCEEHYLDFNDLTLEDFEGLEFDLINDNFFERIEGYGVALIPINGFPVRIAGHGENNGYYSDELILIVRNEVRNIIKEYDITECQDIYL